MGKYFGTDGFRGEANVDLTVMHAFEIGRYLGWYYGREHKARIVIGKDTRRSSYMFESALCAGLTASGADAYLLHVTTTPSVSYIARADDFDCGIMISASHNPYYDNGIKLINGRGEKMSDDVLDGIEEYIDKISAGEPDILPYAKGEKIGRTVDYAAGRNRYIGFLISLATRSYKGKKVGLDCANGSTWMMAKSVFDALGADTYVINNNPDGLNINVDCGSTHIEKIQQFVLEKGLDVGFAFDGDADRCLAVDEKGNIITGDHILYVCGKYMHDCGILGNKKIVTTVMSNMGLYKALDELGIGYEKTKVGDKYVAENMRANGTQAQVAEAIYKGLRYNSDGTDGTLYLSLYNGTLAGQYQQKVDATYDAKVLKVLKQAAASYSFIDASNCTTAQQYAQTISVSFSTMAANSDALVGAFVGGGLAACIGIG